MPSAAFNLEEYLQDLAEQRDAGLLDEEEYQETLRRITKEETSSPRIKVNVEPISEEEPIIKRLADLYYRELFGRVQNDSDQKLVNDVLLARCGSKVAGALWYTLEPTPGYRGCNYLDMLYVLPEFRKAGVGTELLSRLLTYTPENFCIITYAWKPSQDFYSRHGFLATDRTDEKEGQSFRLMVLPLTKKSFERYCREKRGDWLEGMEEVLGCCGNRFDTGFLNKWIDAISNLEPEQETDLAQNPFTAFIYQKNGMKHRLLEYCEKL